MTRDQLAELFGRIDHVLDECDASQLPPFRNGPDPHDETAAEAASAPTRGGLLHRWFTRRVRP